MLVEIKKFNTCQIINLYIKSIIKFFIGKKTSYQIIKEEKYLAIIKSSIRRNIYNYRRGR